MEDRFKKGDIVRHFKRETLKKEDIDKNPNVYLYRIIGTSKHTEYGEKLMIYEPLYETDCIIGVDFAARPLDMFLSEVDHEKYPDIKQKYRFELATSDDVKRLVK